MVEIGTPFIDDVKTNKKLAQLQEKLGYRFGKNIHLLKRAMEHSSTQDRPSNELSSQTLEFLGDAILYLVVTRKLFADQPWQGEDVLTELRKNLIKNSTLTRVGDRLGLRDEGLIQVGKSVHGGNGVTDKMVADAVEAIIGAIYRSDHDRLESVEEFVEKWFFRSGIEKEVLSEIDWTSRLKVWCDKHCQEWPLEPSCRVDDDGLWSYSLVIGEYDETGEGRNKSSAKRQAAFKILQRIESGGIS